MNRVHSVFASALACVALQSVFFFGCSAGQPASDTPDGQAACVHASDEYFATVFCPDAGIDAAHALLCQTDTQPPATEGLCTNVPPTGGPQADTVYCCR